MRECPTCGARYEAPAQYCQRDGVQLRVEQESRDPYLGTKILGQFRLEKIVGAGGMGIVYGGWDEGLGRRVAVKILHRDLVTNRDVVARFHREAQIAHQLDHPNIVRLILFGQLPDKNLYLVLEYLEGPTLLAILDREGPMQPARVVKICSGISEAIGYAHRRDIVHRDLKPENIILVNRDGDPDHPKVLDFGIAKMLIGGDTLVTQAGLIFGTARYISPEGAQGDPVDKRSDVYSLGVITYQLLAGVTPFDAPEPVQLLLKHIHDTPPPLRTRAAARNVPPSLEAVVMRALAKNPAARYTDGTSYARALREALAESDPQSAIRSVVPTASMPLFVPGAVPSGVSPAAAAAVAQSPVFPTVPAMRAEGGSGVRLHPVPAGVPEPHPTMMAGSPAGYPSGYPSGEPTASPSMPHAYAPSMNPQTGFAVGSMRGAPAVAPTVPSMHAVSVPIAAHDGESGPYASPMRDPPSVPSLASAGASTSSIHSDTDEIDIPGLPKRRKPSAASGSTGGSRTVATVIASVIITVLLGIGAVWALGLYPTQRRDTDVHDLLGRAEDAYRAHHFVHENDENDVEDLTDAILALDPSQARAHALRSAAAVELRNEAVELRNGGHADQALPLLRRATRLSDDPEIRELFTQIQREVQNPNGSVVPASATDAPTTAAPATTPPAAPHASTPHVNHVSHPSPHPADTDHDEPTPTMGPPVQAVPNGPTFTPGRDPSVPPPARPTPVVQQQPAQPAAPQNPPPGMMVGGPSQIDTPPQTPPSQDPGERQF